MIPTRLGIIAGMPRAGTTYLYHAFASHPSTFVPYRKELRYFGQQFSRGPKWYSSFFKNAPPKQLCIDCSPDYFLVPEVPHRIKENIPFPRVILGIRDPASWAISLHQQLRNIGEAAPTISEFLTAMQYPDFGSAQPFPKLNLRDGFIRKQIENFRQELGAGVLLFNFDAFGEDPLRVLRSIENFLGLEPYFSLHNLPKGHINAGNRRKSGWFAHVTSRDRTIAILHALFPRKVLLQTRLWLDRMNRTATGLALAKDSEDFRICAESLAQDRAYNRQLFHSGSVIDGNGTVLS